VSISAALFVTGDVTPGRALHKAHSTDLEATAFGAVRLAEAHRCVSSTVVYVCSTVHCIALSLSAALFITGGVTWAQHALLSLEATAFGAAALAEAHRCVLPHQCLYTAQCLALSKKSTVFYVHSSVYCTQSPYRSVLFCTLLHLWSQATQERQRACKR